MLSVDKIRQSFLDFFAQRSSHIEPSSSLIPVDPSILFTIAGMVPFKKMFLGLENKGYNRAASCQRCLRTNDLDNVGRTARHHTFFEMLGNFSFGDYFKEEAIAWSWEFLTGVIGLDPDKLWISVFTDDDEARDIWINKVGVNHDRVVRLGEADNFWRMGETGPCGPCSEILIDQGEAMGCGKPDCAVGCDCDRYLELWNLVFTQYDQQADGTLKPLPKKNIDTGLGLERLAAVLQGKDNNYEIDSIFPLIEYISRLCGIKYGSNTKQDISMKVIADHIRAVTFLISDGVFPGNEGRGYVLRRLIRRAIQHGLRLELKEVFLYQLVGVTVGLMKEAYPELVERREHISSVVKGEEERFHETLQTGSIKVAQLIDELKAQGQKNLPGIEAFRLYDTYGFPFDLTRELAEDAGFAVDEQGYLAALEEQRQRARNMTGFAHEENESEDLYHEILAEVGTTEFSGYEQLSGQATLLALVSGGQKVDLVNAGSEAVFILDKTPFYAESGGQLADHGRLSAAGATIEVTEVRKFGGGLILHHGRVLSGQIKLQGTLKAEVDLTRRLATAAHHTATHLLQAALQKVLGKHVKQSGSFVAANRLRFDFTHPTALEQRELERVEELVNGWIRANLAVNVDQTSYDEAIKAGALAFFGEKYDRVVRVVSIDQVSTELCGGTHARRTGDISLIRIVSESSVAAGIRRIEAIVAEAAWERSKQDEGILAELSSRLSVPVAELTDRVERLLAELKQNEKKLEELTTLKTLAQGAELLKGAREIAGIRCLCRVLEGVPPKQLRNLVDDLKNRLGSGIVFLIAPQDDGVSLVLGVTSDLTKDYNAGKLIASLAQIMGGRGGGRPDFAQAGGKDKGKAEQALAVFEELIINKK